MDKPFSCSQVKEVPIIKQNTTAPGGKSLSTTTLVFMIVAASGPLPVLAGGVPTNYAVSGLLGVPLSYAL